MIVWYCAHYGQILFPRQVVARTVDPCLALAPNATLFEEDFSAGVIRVLHERCGEYKLKPLAEQLVLGIFS